MTADACPRCGLEYERCECPATRGKAVPSSPAEWDAICKRAEGRRAIRAILEGAVLLPLPDKRLKRIERHIDTGRVTHGGIDGYTADWPQAERSAWQKRRDSRVRRGHMTEDRDGH